MTKSSKANQPPCKVMCATCPFREGSEYEYLRGYLAVAALTTGNRICHSTGVSAIKGRTGKPERTCRGSRDVQLRFFHQLKVIAEPTDEAWDEAYKRTKNEHILPRTNKAGAAFANS